MRRWLVPAAFLVVACSTIAEAAKAALTPAAHPASVHVLVVLYWLLRTAVAVAFAAFTVNRDEPSRRARDPLAFAACATAMLAIVAVTGPTSGTAPALLVAGDAIAVTGCVWLLASVLALGRCFGILPEARGLVRRGPYRLVRHPVYLGEIVAVGGLVLAAPSGRNLAVMAVFVGAQVIRMHFEERALTEAFPEYASYASATGRLFPQLRSRPSPATAAD